MPSEVDRYGRTLQHRLDMYTDKSGDCWEWTASLTTHGYGEICFNRKRMGAHRVALMLSGVDIEGRLVCHKCNNRKCVRPSHLYTGSYQDNSNDRKAAGTLLTGQKNPKAKLTTDDVKKIRNSKDSCVSLAAEYGVSYSTISKIKLGRTWLCVK